MSASLLYLHPKAKAALDKAIVLSTLRPVVVQTQGGAAQSAGTHGSAGTYVLNGTKHSYSACIDFSVNQPASRLSDHAKVTMNAQRIHWFLEHLAEQGICGFYRLTSQGFDSAHIHAIFSMVPMLHPNLDSRRIVEDQVIDFVSGRNGLKGHAQEKFYLPSDDYNEHIATLFAVSNPVAAKRLPAKYRGRSA